MAQAGEQVPAGTDLRSVPVTRADAARIREALEQVLQGAPFRTSRQCQTLLKYMVEHTLAGESDLLRERVIGAEVFGRGPGYEPGEDPIVRVRAAEVRKRLAQYYQSCSGNLVRIDVPAGSYKAVFEWKQGDVLAPPAHRPGQRFPGIWIALAILTLTAGALAVWALRPAPGSTLDRFWAPAVGSPKPILIYTGTTPVFRSADLSDSSRDLVQVSGQYMCVGDSYASVMVASLLARKGKLYQMRYGNDLTFGDLRYQPSILIGAFDNVWTLETTNDLRFVFDRHPTIRDRSSNRLYTLPKMTPDGRTPEDYAIVSRIFDSKTGELLITAAGITQYGTRAAGEFLTSPQLMELLSRSAPGDWPRKNLQVLLHTNIVGDTPGPPTVVTACYW